MAILKDLNGVAQMLAIPTRKIAGIEDPQMLAPDAPPVFADAWKAKAAASRRGSAASRCRARRSRSTINSKWSRSQQQLHVHVDCVAKPVAAALAEYRSALDDQLAADDRSSWPAEPISPAGSNSADLADADPLKLLADGVPGAKANMGAWTLAAVGADVRRQAGLHPARRRFSLEGGGHAEDLQDHDCVIARTAP